MLRGTAFRLMAGVALTLAFRAPAADQAPAANRPRAASPASGGKAQPPPNAAPAGKAGAPAGKTEAPAGKQAERVPSQPVAFSHKIHAGDNKIGCLLCHTYAEHSPVAGIPSLARCIGCHKFVDKNKPDIKAINQAYQKGKVLVWNRIYRLQDFVFFTHERHVAAGIRCQQCHGEIETMDVVKQASSLTMGWCLNCHHQHQAPADCITCHK